MPHVRSRFLSSLESNRRADPLSLGSNNCSYSPSVRVTSAPVRQLWNHAQDCALAKEKQTKLTDKPEFEGLGKLEASEVCFAFVHFLSRTLADVTSCRCCRLWRCGVLVTGGHSGFIPLKTSQSNWAVRVWEVVWQHFVMVWGGANVINQLLGPA